MVKYITKSCLICGKSFLTVEKGNARHREKTIRQKFAVTCSRVCARRYATIYQKLKQRWLHRKWTPAHSTMQIQANALIESSSSVNATLNPINAVY